MNEVLKAAIAHYGEQMQVIVAIEELSELQKELTKFLRGQADERHINEEMADVEIMLEQLKLMFGNRAAVTYWSHKKIDRLRKRIVANENRCVCCGAIIPEGRMVCPRCEK